MTIPRWHMDHAQFGHPEYSLTQQPHDSQFMRFPGNKGLGQYRELNERAPQQATLSWMMSDKTFGDFTAAWNDVNLLCFGANWFTLDLPLMHSQFDQQVDYQTEQQFLVKQRFALTVGISSNTNIVGHQALTTNNTGKVSPAVFAGTHVTQLDIGTDTNIHFQLATFAPLTNNLSNVRIYCGAPADDPTKPSIATWNAANFRYQTNVNNAQPNAAAYWRANIGETIPVDVEFLTTPFQRYRCHFRDVYSANAIGYQHWNVQASVDVDVTPEFEVVEVAP